MDGNKDEALRCVRNAEEAIASGNKGRAMKFIKIAQRLNSSLNINELLAACEKLDMGSVNEKVVEEKKEFSGGGQCSEGFNKGRSYTEEHVHLIRRITSNRDYYNILGIEKSCSVEEIRKAYRKLSLKVHPDKNKAPGSEEAFKKVCKAFKCLSNDDSRRQYDQMGLVEDYEYNQQHNVRRRRRRTEHEFFQDEFDPDEIFRAFFGQPDVFRRNRVYRTRETYNYQREEVNGGGPNFMVLLQILPFLLIFLLAYLPFSEPEYSLHKNMPYQVPRMTEKHGVEFFVKTSAFDQNFPLGTPARANIEENVIKDYKNMLRRYCHIEVQRRHWSKNMPTPHCDKLQNLVSA